MAVTINASTTTGLVQSADTSGIIELQNNGTTKLTVNSSGATIPTATITTGIITTLSDGTNSTSATNCIQGSAKAWVNYKGTATVAIRASYNVSSVTVNSTGDYTVNMTNALADANYAFVGTAGGGSSNPNNYFTGPSTATTMSTTQFRFQTRNDGAGLVDSDTIMISVFR